MVIYPTAMPRATAGAVRSSTGGVAALGLGQKRSLQVAKTSAAVRQTRAALGEITNVRIVYLHTFSLGFWSQFF